MKVTLAATATAFLLVGKAFVLARTHNIGMGLDVIRKSSSLLLP